MKKTLLFAILMVLAFSSQAQHFEWVKGYGTSENGACHITGSVTDSVGNLYILGQFRNDSEWGTGWSAERLLPMAPYGPHPYNGNVIIAKISSEGEMVWKKVIHTNNGISTTSYDIKKVGDTAFACLVDITLPTEDHYTFYLDTLIPGRSDYPVKSMYIGYPVRTAFIMFDFEGNVIEQHFLYVTYTDTAGNDFVSYFNRNIDPTPWLDNWSFQYASFDIDNDGNIFISRVTNDYLFDSVNAENGTIRGIKFWVDSNIVGQCPVENKPRRWYPQILKFSPHFDSLVVSKYVVQKNNNIDYTAWGTQIKIGRHDEVYFLMNIYQNGYEREDTIVIDSLQNLFWTHIDKAMQKDFLVQLSSDLTPQWIITLGDSIISSEYSLSSGYVFLDFDFDYDSNLLFISGETSRGPFGDTSNFCSMLTYLGTPLNIKNDGFFISFDLRTPIPELHSYGKVPGIFFSSCTCPSLPTRNTIRTCGNRVFLQGKFLGGIRVLGQTIQFNNRYDYGLGLIIFDYGGNVTELINYNAYSSHNLCGPISLQDSILYLAGVLVTDATFKDIIYDIPTSKFAFLAKYVDTSFMTPYTGDTGDLNIMLTPDAGVFTAYPNPFRQRVNIKIENTELKAVNGRVTAMLTDITGRSEEVPLAPQGGGHYVLDLTARPQASYFLTLTTADGHQHTVQLLKQSDRFGTD